MEFRGCKQQHGSSRHTPVADQLHSTTSKEYVAPRMPKTGYIQEIRGPWLI
jgi:hypothetical protein